MGLPINYLDGYYQANIETLKNAGFEIYFFTAENSEDIEKAIQLGANGIYVDAPDKLIKNIP